MCYDVSVISLGRFKLSGVGAKINVFIVVPDYGIPGFAALAFIEGDAVVLRVSFVSEETIGLGATFVLL